MGGRSRLCVAMVVLGALLGACADSNEGALPSATVSIVVHDREPGVAFDRRLLGTNLPAWVGPSKLADRAFQDDVVQSGATVVRMPGGSWSNDYDWLACENGTPDCPFTGPARPSDFLGFLDATGLAGMWTVNINETAQQAAALVAFFNGAVGDTRSIGVDRNGVDWATVGRWAMLRADHGHPAPLPIREWEIGNEVYGATGDGGGDCASYAWEKVWTCDGAAYIAGNGGHDGFNAISAAMKLVDPTIAIGAVGVADGASWNHWGDEVVRGSGSTMDFYVIHQYAFGGRPSTAGALTNPASSWPEVMAGVAASFHDQARQVPVAVTEYNLSGSQDTDDDRLMTKAVDAVFVADTIGQMAEHGVAMANQWNAINGAAQNGTDYGMIDVAGRRAPQFSALAVWSNFGTTMVPLTASDTTARRFSAYASTDGPAAVVVLINKTGVVRHADVAADGITGTARASVATVAATDLAATDVTWNGVSASTMTGRPPLRDLGTVAMPAAVDLPPYSLTLLRLTPV